MSVPWFLKTTNTENALDGEQAARDFQISVAAVGSQGARVLDDFRPDAIVMVNGEFASERTFRDLARGIRGRGLRDGAAQAHRLLRAGLARARLPDRHPLGRGETAR